MNKLEKICIDTKNALEIDKKKLPLEKIREHLKNNNNKSNFIKRIKEKNGYKIIAEIKKSSPSAGLIRKDFCPKKIAKDYEKAGAACLSILTNKIYFEGSIEHIKEVKQVCLLPILRKEFIVDEYQIYEAKYINSDCILLIASALSGNQLQEYEHVANELNLDVLIENHDEYEIEKSLKYTKTILFGINNRNLKTMETDINTSVALKKYIPNDKIIVSESGLKTKENLNQLAKNNINTFLIGEALLKKNNILEATKKLLIC